MRPSRPACTRPHYIRGNKSTALPMRVLCFDVQDHEVKRDEDRQFRRFGAGVSCLLRWVRGREQATEEWKAWKKPKDLLRYFNLAARPHRTTYFLSARPGRCLWLLEAYTKLGLAGVRCEFMHEDAATYILRAAQGRRRLVFLSLHNLIPLELEEIRRVVGLSNPWVDFGERGGTPELARALINVDTIRRAVIRYRSLIEKRDLGAFRLTVASQAWSAYRHRFMPVKLLADPEERTRKLATSALYPPLVSVPWTGEYREGDWVKVDVNSLYGFCMREFRYPRAILYSFGQKPPRELQELLSAFCVIAEVTVSPGPLPVAHRIDWRPSYSTKRVRTVLATGSLLELLRLERIEVVHRGIVYEPCQPFSEYVDYFAAMKREAKREGDVVAQVLAKACLVRLWGRFNRRVPITTQVEECDPQRITSTTSYQFGTFRRRRQSELMGVRWTDIGERQADDASPEIAAHVADYAHQWMQQIIAQVGRENVVYHDADAIITEAYWLRRLKGWVHPSELGKVKVEGRGHTLSVFTEKDYELGAQVVIKGIKSNAIRISHRQYLQDEYPGVFECARRAPPGLYPVDRIAIRLPLAGQKADVHAPASAPSVDGAPF